MTVKVVGEGNATYPVLAIDRWNVYTLGMPSGGVRNVGGDMVIVVPEK